MGTPTASRAEQEEIASKDHGVVDAMSSAQRNRAVQPPRHDRRGRRGAKRHSALASCAVAAGDTPRSMTPVTAVNKTMMVGRAVATLVGLATLVISTSGTKTLI